MTLKFDVTVRHVFASAPGEAEASVVSLLRLLLQKANNMAATLDDVVQKVTQQGTVIQSAVTLLTELKTKLDEAIASGTMQRVQEISDQLDTQRQQLADAVQANTPQAGGGQQPPQP